MHLVTSVELFSPMKITSTPWSSLSDGTAVTKFILDDEAGTRASIINLGATLQSLETPDRNGKSEDIVLGFDKPQDYVDDTSYQAAAIGRFGNRIGGAKFTLDGVEYKLPANNGDNCLHGGFPSFERKVWKAMPIKGEGFIGVDMFLFSPDGENGFPGDLYVRISFRMTEKGALSISYKASTTKATPVNMTHHMYYNLSGNVENDILSNVLHVCADRTTTVDENMVPTGELASVEGTPFDFRTPKAVGTDIDQDNQQLKIGGGYDHNLVFENADGTLKLQADVYDPQSGRIMEILTTEPAVQFYSANSLSGAIGKGGKPLNPRHALCLETQHYPDSPNKPQFPSTILAPGDTYRSETVLRFSTDGK